jgi:XisI protein
MDKAMKDKLTKYRDIARSVVMEYASHRLSHGDIQTEPVIDTERDHYEVIHVGWDSRGFRVHSSVIHLDIIDGKVWIQHDSTDWPVADALMEAGVPKEDIVLGFHPVEVREYTGFAA